MDYEWPFQGRYNHIKPVGETGIIIKENGVFCSGFVFTAQSSSLYIVIVFPLRCNCAGITM